MNRVHSPRQVLRRPRPSSRASRRPPGPNRGLQRLVAGAALMLAAGCGSLQADPKNEAAPAAAQGGARAVAASAAPTDRPSARAPGPYRPENLPNVALTPPMLYELLAAEIGLQRKQLGSAYNSYFNLATQTRDARLARRATEIALGGRAYDQALTSAKLWAELDAASSEAGDTVQTLLLATSRLAEAEPALVRRLETARKSGRLPDTYAQLQRTLPRIQDRKGAWAMLSRISEPDLDVAAARSARAAVADAADDKPAAAAEALAAHTLAPDDSTLAIAAAQYAQQLPGDGQARAVQILETFLKRKPDSQDARIALGRSYLIAKQLDPARATLRGALERDASNPQLLFLLAQASYQAKDLDAADDYLKRFTALPDEVERDDSPAWVFRAQIAEDRKRNAEAIAFLKKVDGGELFLSSLARRAILMTRDGDLEGARKLLEGTPARNKREQAQLASAQAGVLREANRYQEAWDVLDKALAQDPDNTDLLYDHAMAAEKIDRIDVLEKSLRHLITLRPDNAHAYNALGYTLADRNQRLPEALALIDKAISMAPDDPQIIDSLGWVHYRMGDTAKALEHLRRAYRLKPDVEVAAHLGEVLWTSGAKDEALKVWREASGREPMNEVLLGTLARLNVPPL
ncbi:MAG: tetratricopeptide repeat protein [Lautropia sp.]